MMCNLLSKYINAVPLYRIEIQFEADGLDITRQEMVRWTIASAERYLSVLYDYLHERMYRYHVLHTDELCEASHNSSYEKLNIM